MKKLDLYYVNGGVQICWNRMDCDVTIIRRYKEKVKVCARHHAKFWIHHTDLDVKPGNIYYYQLVTPSHPVSVESEN